MEPRATFFSFICIHLSDSDRLSFTPTPLSCPQTIRWVCDLSRLSPCSSLSIHRIFVFPLSRGTVWELFRARMQRESSELCCSRTDDEERKAGAGDFSLDEVMGDGTPWAGAELVADPPLTSLCQNTHLAGERVEPMEARRWHLVFISAHYTTANLKIQIALSLSSTSHNSQLRSGPQQTTLVGLAMWKALIKSTPLLAERWRWLVKLQLASSACICADTTFSAPMLSHLEERTDLYYST